MIYGGTDAEPRKPSFWLAGRQGRVGHKKAVLENSRLQAQLVFLKKENYFLSVVAAGLFSAAVISMLMALFSIFM